MRLKILKTLKDAIMVQFKILSGQSLRQIEEDYEIQSG
jgi:hypothetical protein